MAAYSKESKMATNTKDSKMTPTLPIRELTLTTAAKFKRTPPHRLKSLSMDDMSRVSKLTSLSSIAEDDRDDYGPFRGMDWTKQVDQQRVFVSYHGERKDFEVAHKETIKELKERARQAFVIPPDNGPAGMELEDQKILTLQYAGAQLADHWTLGDIGVPNGSTVRAVLKLEKKPSIYVYCAFNDETVPITDKINIQTTTGGTLRGMASRQTGLPVTVFRLCTQDGKEIFDGKLLFDYGVNLRDTLRLEVWDGWKEFINLCIMGFTRHVMAHLPTDDEVLARFQQKVAMYISAHFSHVDLAVTLLKQGIRADEAIGEHPMRQWCKHQSLHIDALKAPVHEAAEAGSLSVLRSFVHNNVCNVLAKDGNDLAPLNLALRRKQKPCASFLLTKQWSKIGYTKKHSVHLSIYVKMKRWAERSRNKVLVIYGQWKSSIKNPKKHIQIGALLGQGVQLDGWSQSKMTTKAEAEYRRELDEEKARKERLYANPIPPDMDPDVYFRSMRKFQTKMKLPHLNKMSKVMQRVAKDAEKDSVFSERTSDSESDFEESLDDNFDTRHKSYRPRSNSHSGVRLPPITEKKKGMSSSQQNLSTLNLDDPEFRRHKSKSKHHHQQDHKHGKSLKHSQSQQSLGEPKSSRKSESDEESPRKKKKDRNAHSALLIAKAKTEGGSIPLPMVSNVGIPRPFIRSSSEDLTRGTLSLYEKYRGLGSRDYAIKCLTVANTFSEKPWLQQVQQALTISRQGIKKCINKESHMFTPREEDKNKNDLPPSLASTPQTNTRSSRSSTLMSSAA